MQLPVIDESSAPRAPRLEALTPRRRGVGYLFALTLITVFLAETLLTMLFRSATLAPSWWIAVVDGVLLACVLAPLIYQLWARPYLAHERVQNELSESKQILDDVAAGMSESLMLLSPDFRILWANKAALEALGPDPRAVTGRFCYEVSHHCDEPCAPPDHPCPVLDLESSGKPKTFSHTHFDGRGGQREVEVTAYPIVDNKGRTVRLVHLSRDVTEKRLLERELLRAQKMEAVGKLAGGIAHDFNNLLMGVIGGCQIASSKLERGSMAKPFLDEVIAAANSGVVLTRRLLAFSKREPSKPEPIELNRVIRESESMFRRLVKDGLRLELDLFPGECTVSADPGTIEQVVMNLVVNADAASPRGSTIRVCTSELRLEDEECRARDLPPGTYFLLSVKDEGVGMDEETQARCFEPFFTTKGSEGTGLGLATVYGIVRQLDGHIELSSRAGQGSEFRVYLPVQEGRKARPRLPSDLPTKSRGTALVVEDEVLVRMTVRGYLDRLGYQTFGAGSSVDALRLCEQHAWNLDLLLTDVRLPDRSGPLLASDIRKRVPELKVIFMSALPRSVLLDQGQVDEEACTLEKPFSKDALSQELKSLGFFS